ncbi:MAG: alkaline phosphatase family protein [Lachnospiraceae bacterium]|nr:alkaline phosphatase family protein [Lachnospiraceae bacterium]
MSKKHLIIISVDALVGEDLENLSELPNFRKMIENGSFTKNIITIYPSLTHAVHASIITGQPAGITGVTENTRFTPGEKDMPWFNEYSEIKCETILELAHRAGLVTASCRWPVTAHGNEFVDYLVPEIMGADMEEAGGDWRKAYEKVGTTPCLMDMIGRAVKKHGAALSHPIYDEVQIDCVCEIIKTYKPNLLLTHPGFVDGERHRTGLFSEFVKSGVKKSDEWVGRIMDAAKEAGIYDDTDFIVLSDHGHLPYKYCVNLNGFLVKEGLIRLDAEGKIKDWDVYAQSCDLSNHIYLKNPEDTALRMRVETLFDKWIKEDTCGIESYITAAEAEKRFGLTGGFSYVLESKEGYTFEDDWREPLIYENPPVSEGLGHSAHGHLPNKGPKPVFIGFGPSFKKECIDGGDILDCFNVFKRVLGL